MKFGQYELLEPIAVGGMAEVFKGRVVAAEGFEKFVAIKRILPDLAEDERFVKMLLTEARIHSALSHRNIVQIHDLGISEDGQYFIVLEYVEGYDLRIIGEQLTAEGEIIPEALSLHIASEVAQGLHFAHDMRGPDGQPLGLVHRDVTPSNILISFAGEVKLSDFGLAKRRHDRSVVGSLKGNLSYMSPEQAMQAPLDRRTDIFSLGAVLFELLTGRRLREITNEVAGWSQVASGVVPSARQIRPDLPVAIERLLDRALAADPAQRFPDAAAFGTAIREVLSQMNVPVGASDLGALLGLVNPPRRPRILMLERSGVIRLGPEAQALREAFAAAITPAPLTAPGMTPASAREGGLSIARAAAAAPAAPSASPSLPVDDPMATPPPTTPLPALRPRGRTPLPPARPRGVTPLPPDRRRAATPLPPARPRAATPLPPDRQRAATPLPPDRQRAATPLPPARARGATPLPPARPRGATPLPPARPRGATPLPPARPRGATPLPPARPRGATPLPPARPRGATPLPPAQVTERRPTAASRAPLTAPRSARTTGQRAVVPQQTIPGTPAFGTQRPPMAGTPAFGTQRPPMPRTPAFGMQRPPVAGTPAFGTQRPPMAGTPAFGTQRPTIPGSPAFGAQRPPMAGTPAFGTQRPAIPGTRGPSMPSSRGAQPSFGGPVVPRGLAPARVQRETARVQLRSRSHWPAVLVLLMLMAAGGVAAIHYFVVPLDVLLVWRNPARLSIATLPEGATLRVDGSALAAPSPTIVSVGRDRADHVIEATLAGYHPARAIARYDRSLSLAFLLRLQQDPTVVVPSAPVQNGAPVGPGSSVDAGLPGVGTPAAARTPAAAGAPAAVGAPAPAGTPAPVGTPASAGTPAAGGAAVREPGQPTPSPSPSRASRP